LTANGEAFGKGIEEIILLKFQSILKRNECQLARFIAKALTEAQTTHTFYELSNTKAQDCHEAEKAMEHLWR